MSFVSAPVASLSSIRYCLTASLTVGSVCILPWSFVAAPPNLPESHAVQLASVALPLVPQWTVDLDRMTSRQDGALTAANLDSPRTFVRVVPQSGSPTPADTVGTEAVIQPMIDSPAVGTAASVAPTPGVSVLGVILAAGAYFLIFGVLIPLAFINGFIGYNLIDPILSLFGVATPAAAPVAAATLQAAPELSASAPAGIASAAPATDAGPAPAPAEKRARTEGATPMTSASKKGRMATDTGQLTGKTTERFTTTDAAQPADSGSTPKPAKPTTRRGQSDSAERGSLNDTDKTSNSVHRRNAGHAADPKGPKGESSDNGGDA